MASTDINQIGAYVAAKQALVPLANAAGTRNGTGIDRSTVAYAKSCVLVAQLGAATGTPTSFTHNLKIQHSSDNGSGDAWADYTPPTGTAALAQQTAGSALVEKDIDLTGAKQYVRVVETIAFVGGTSPALPASAAFVFGGGDSLPL